MAKKKGKKGNKKSSGKKSNSKKSTKQRIKKELKKRYPVYISVLVLLFLLLYAVIGSGIGLPGETSSEVVATVNQEKITREDLDSYKSTLEQQGQSSDDMSALQNLIDRELLYQEAKNQMNISDEDVENALEQQLDSQGQSLDDLKQQVEKQGRDYDSVLENYKKQMVLSQYYQSIMQGPGMNVTDQEVRDFYDENEEAISQQAPNSTYEDIKPAIKQQLQQQKAQQKLQTIVTNLRENANINIKEENLNQTQQNNQMEVPSELA